MQQYAPVVSTPYNFQPYQSYQTLNPQNIGAIQQNATTSQGSGLATFADVAQPALTVGKELFPQTFSAAKELAKGAVQKSFQSIGNSVGLGTGTAATGTSTAASAATSTGLTGGSGSATLGSAVGADTLGIGGANAASAGSSLISSVAIPGLAGAAGGYLFSSLTGGSKTGSSIGGSVGAIAGNFILPGIGGFIGGALGGVAGSLFGNKKPSNQSAGANFNPFTGEVMRQGNKGSANLAGRQSVLDSTTESMQRMQTIFGFDYTKYQKTESLRKAGLEVKVDVGSRDGTQLTIGNAPKERLKSPDEASLKIVQSLTKTLSAEQRTNVTPELQKVINGKYSNLGEFMYAVDSTVSRAKNTEIVDNLKISDDRAFEDFYAKYKKMKENQ